MAITLVVKSAVVDLDKTDAEIATLLNVTATYTSIYGMSIMPISNTKAKIIVIYA